MLCLFVKASTGNVQQCTLLAPLARAFAAVDTIAKNDLCFTLPLAGIQRLLVYARPSPYTLCKQVLSIFMGDCLLDFLVCQNAVTSLTTVNGAQEDFVLDEQCIINSTVLFLCHTSHQPCFHNMLQVPGYEYQSSTSQKQHRDEMASSKIMKSIKKEKWNWLAPVAISQKVYTNVCKWARIVR